MKAKTVRKMSDLKNGFFKKEIRYRLLTKLKTPKISESYERNCNKFKWKKSVKNRTV